jgi:Flp pilus assembly protein TadD
VAYSPDGQRLASASFDQTVRVWDATTGLKGLSDQVDGVAYSPDGRRLASGGWDKTVRVWDAASGQELLTLKGHTHYVHGVAFSPDSRRLASASADGAVRVWDAISGQEMLTLKGHAGPVAGVAFSPDGQRLASAGGDGTVRMWDTVSGAEILTLKGDAGGVQGVAFSRDGQRLASAGAGGTVRVWETSPVPAEIWRQRGLVSDVRALFDKLLLREEVIAALRRDRMLSDADREFALQVAQTDPKAITHDQLNVAAWKVVKAQDAGREAYALALRQAEAAVSLAPDDGYDLNTLGVALYRMGKYVEALTTLMKSEKLNATQEGSHPADLAFLAMAQHKLRKKDEAKATLGQLREVMKLARWAMDDEVKGFLPEAEELIEGKPAEKQK